MAFVDPSVSESSTSAMAASWSAILRVDDHLVLVEAVLVERLGGAHAFTDALRQKLVALDVHQLVLQGR